MDEQRFYVLDWQDRICATGGDWDRFAVENNALGAKSSQVLGVSIWKFIRGFEVQSYMNALFFSARKMNRVISLPYRCDSPDEPRLFMMRVVPMQEYGLKVEHHAKFLQMNKPEENCVPLVSRHSEAKCSVCCSFKIENEWVDPFVRPSELDFPRGLSLCPKCKEDAITVLSRSSDRDERIRNFV